MSRQRLIGIAIVPELVPTKDLSRTGKKMPISLRNITDHPITLGAKEAFGKEECQRMQTEIQHFFKALPPAWQRRMKLQLARWEKIFWKNDFDVGCVKSA